MWPMPIATPSLWWTHDPTTVVRTLNVGLYRSAPLGSSPNALALTRDGETLYVANGANNAVAVVNPLDTDNPVQGFIPTGWYPTAVALDGDDRQLCIASGYGFGSIAPLAGGQTGRSYKDRVGVVSILDVPDPLKLAPFTAQVRLNNRAEQKPPRPADRRHPVPMDAGRTSPIRHVFYIIKENRTYDQVFGDIAQGNGDASLVQFGRDVTPNHHALAETVRPARQLLRAGRSVGAGAPLVHARICERLAAQVQQRP